MAVEILVDDDVELPSELQRRFATELRRMVKRAATDDGHRDYDVALRLVNDPAIHALNRDFRKKDKPTDVLAFAHRETPAGALHPEVLGDLVISIETARRQAKRGLPYELLHLASHGLCHLLGYDHADDTQERAMNARAAELRRAARPERPAKHAATTRATKRADKQADRRATSQRSSRGQRAARQRRGRQR